MLTRRINKSLTFVCFIFSFNLSTRCSEIKVQKQQQVLKIPDTALTRISNLSDSEHFMKTLNKILIPRVPGSEGSKKVRTFIKQTMQDLKWHVDTDVFFDKTPHGEIEFENIIAIQNPEADSYLVMACHYDSKYFAEEEFLGATDSAVPCAMMINLAHVMKDNLTKQNKQKNGIDIGLMFIFFDGEEAFVEWGPLDSIYGARHLAAEWESNGFLKKIKLFMLLDLLGSADPKFYSYFEKTNADYIKLMKIEDTLMKYSALDKHVSSGVISRPNLNYFQERSASLYVEDDHIPFLNRNVPILHVIPVPFPDVWHKPEDNMDAIDLPTCDNLNKIFRIFVAEYLNIDFDE